MFRTKFNEVEFPEFPKGRPQIVALICILLLCVGFGAMASTGEPRTEQSQLSQPSPAPVEEVPISEEDEIVRSAKQEQYCFRVNAHLGEPALTEAIDKCLIETASWSIEELDAKMPPDPLG